MPDTFKHDKLENTPTILRPATQHEELLPQKTI